MRTDTIQIYMTLSNGMAALWMLAYLGGFWVCVVHRRLSTRLIVVAIGFVGLFASVGVGRFASLTLDRPNEWIYLVYMMSSVAGCLSTIVLVFGLGATLVDLRRQLSRTLDPPYARR